MVCKIMKVYKYKNYAEYKKCQIAANTKKSKNIWAKEENIKAIAGYIKQHKSDKIHGICHGVRQGHEVIWFYKYLRSLDCEIIGTEIGNINHPLIFQWDFNVENPLWNDKFDFVYSNSFDHAFMPEMTIQVWAKQLKSDGLIILEYDRRQEHTGEISKKINKTDPVSIRFNELQRLIPEWIPGSRIIKIMDMPVITQEWRKAIIINVT